MPLVPRQDHDDGPPTPSEYVVLLVLLIVGAVAYLVYRQRWRSGGTFSLNDLGPVHLPSDSGPSHESFLTNNASSDSLPAHLEADVPFLPQRVSDEAAALARNLHHNRSASGERFPSTGLNPASHHNITSPTDLTEETDPTGLLAELNPVSHHTATATAAAAAIPAPAPTGSTRTPSPATPAEQGPAKSDPLGAGSATFPPTAPAKYTRRSARHTPTSTSEGSRSSGEGRRVFALESDDDD